MKALHPRRSQRPGFSLIELLVVISIIAILISLVVVFIVPMLRKGPDLFARDDISKLTQGMQQFEQDFNVKTPPPVPFRLCATKAQYQTLIAANDTVAAASLQYLSSVFPNLDWTVPHFWGGGTAATDPTASGTGVLLDGDQVLVFFLGGIPSQSPVGCLGFSNNPKYPEIIANSTATKGPFFPFQTARLYIRSGSNFFSYCDAYYDPSSGATNAPYVYFSAGRVKNGYNTGALTPATAYSVTNPYSITINGSSVAAYWGGTTTSAQYYNPTSFQIITAGQDHLFGPGGAPVAGTVYPWAPANASANATLVGQNGMDDMSNFHGAKIGVPGT